MRSLALSFAVSVSFLAVPSAALGGGAVEDPVEDLGAFLVNETGLSDTYGDWLDVSPGAQVSTGTLVAAGGHGHEGEHYIREPFVADSCVSTVTDFSVESDADLTSVVYLCANDVYATSSNGRSLEGTYSAPVVISDANGNARSLQRDSVQVVGDEAFATWAEDVGGDPSATRIFFSRFDTTSGTWTPAAQVNDTGYPVGGDVTAWAVIAKPGFNLAGHTAVHVFTLVESAGADELFLSVLANLGTSFPAPTSVTTSGGDVRGLGLDTQLAELHLTWIEEVAASGVVRYQFGLTNFIGEPFFPNAAVNVSSGGSDAVGTPVIGVNNEFDFGSGFDQKFVSIAWLYDDGDGTNSLNVRSSLDSGQTWDGTSPEHVVAQTGDPGVNVYAFDLEVLSDTVEVAWEDDSDGCTGSPCSSNDGEHQVYRLGSPDGNSAWTGPAEQISNQVDEPEPDHTGVDVKIARSVGTPDASVIAFIEHTGEGPEVKTSYADQSVGEEFHEGATQVSEAQEDGGGLTLDEVVGPQVAYNYRYNNFVTGWLQETGPSSGINDLVIGGYRPQQVEIEGWEVGSPGFSFHVEHLAFQDTFAFVLISFEEGTTGPGLVLPDGRETGMVPDVLTELGLTSFFPFFVAPNVSADEGAETPVFPVPPPIAELEIFFCAVSWGPFGDLHFVTDVFEGHSE